MKCGYGVEQDKANEKDCVGCHFLIGEIGKPTCDWTEKDGVDEISGPSHFTVCERCKKWNRETSICSQCGIEINDDEPCDDQEEI